MQIIVSAAFKAKAWTLKVKDIRSRGLGHKIWLLGAYYMTAQQLLNSPLSGTNQRSWHRNSQIY